MVPAKTPTIQYGSNLPTIKLQPSKFVLVPVCQLYWSFSQWSCLTKPTKQFWTGFHQWCCLSFVVWPVSLCPILFDCLPLCHMLSVCLSVCPSVCLSVRPSLSHTLSIYLTSKAVRDGEGWVDPAVAVHHTWHGKIGSTSDMSMTPDRIE